jgi:hypothetical protein
MFHSKTRVITGICAVVAAATVGMTPADARGRHADRVTGTYSVSDPGVTNCTPKPQHPERLRCDTSGFVSHYEGDLVGDSNVDFSWRIDCDRGRSEGEGVETFAGSLDGGPSGTLTWRIRFHSRFDCSGFFPFDFDGYGTVRDGSGGFEGAQGSLRFGDTTYEGRLR